LRKYRDPREKKGGSGMRDGMLKYAETGRNKEESEEGDGMRKSCSD